MRVASPEGVPDSAHATDFVESTGWDEGETGPASTYERSNTGRRFGNKTTTTNTGHQQTSSAYL